MAAYNALLFIAGALLIALVGEVYFRLTKPFINNSLHLHFVDGVGLLRKPNAEVYYAKWNDDNFVVSRVNSLGFLDREPVSAERAAAGCHIAFIGDSFVESKESPIADKFHVRMEEMAARELPRLAVSTQAYGIGGTGQINQLPFYDEYARRLNPKVVVLVFFRNDFVENSSALKSLGYGADPDHLPYMSAQRDESGSMKLRPPDPEFRRFMLPQLRLSNAWHDRAWGRLVRISYFAKWLDEKNGWVVNRIKTIGAGIGAPIETDPQITAWADMIAALPCCSSLLDGWQPARWKSLHTQFTEEHLPPVLEDALAYTAFGIDQFKLRADRDGARMVIMAATSYMGTRGDPQFDRLNAIADSRGIPVISDYDYIVRQGYDAEDGLWRFNQHWNAIGHQWAAEAVLEWLKENQDVCD